MNKGISTSQRLRLLFGIAISVLTFGILLWMSDLDVIINALRQLNPILVIGVLAFLVISLITRAVAWRIILNEKVSLWKSFLIINAGYLLNTIFPFRAGEIGRVILLLPSGLSFWEALPSIMIERLFDLLIATFLFLVGLPFALEYPVSNRYIFSLLGLFLLGLFFLILFYKHQDRLLIWMENSKLPWEKFRRWMAQRLRLMMTGLKVFSDPIRFIQTFFWMAVSWGIAVLLQYWLLLNFAPEAPLIWSVFGLGALSLGISIPSSPGNIGVYEASLTLALTALGMNQSAALAYALTSHALSIGVTTIIGSYAVGNQGVALGEIREYIRKDPEEII